MVSFADFMTLMFALFVVLFAISVVDEDKLQQVGQSMEQAFGVMQSQGPNFLEGQKDALRPIPPLVTPVVPAPAAPPPATTSETQAQVEQKALLGRLDTILKQTQNLASAVQLRQESRGVVIQLKDTRLFASGSADLRPELLQELKQIVKELERLQQPVRIEGHTDNVPINRTGAYRSNWELSAARATSVLQFFLAQSQMSPQSFSVAGYGEYRPIASNATPEGQARNRRVDIVILNTQALQDEPKVLVPDNDLNQQLNQKLNQRRS